MKLFTCDDIKVLLAISFNVNVNKFTAETVCLLICMTTLCHYVQWKLNTAWYKKVQSQ